MTANEAITTAIDKLAARETRIPTTSGAQYLTRHGELVKGVDLPMGFTKRLESARDRGRDPAEAVLGDVRAHAEWLDQLDACRSEFGKLEGEELGQDPRVADAIDAAILRRVGQIERDARAGLTPEAAYVKALTADEAAHLRALKSSNLFRKPLSTLDDERTKTVALLEKMLRAIEAAQGDE